MLQLDLLDPHIAHLRSVFMSRKDTLCAALRKLCPECAFVEPAGGYFVWLQLPRGVDAEQLLAEASARHGVAFTPGARCSLPAPSSSSTGGSSGATGDRAGGDARAMMSRSARLSFAFYSDDEIRVGVQRLSSALAHIASSQRSLTHPSVSSPSTPEPSSLVFTVTEHTSSKVGGGGQLAK